MDVVLLAAAAAVAALQHFHLLQEEDLDQVAIERIRNMNRLVRPPHPMVHRLTMDLHEPKELLEVVNSDPELAGRVLRTVNSAAFALTTPISSVTHAISYLGTALVKDIVTQFLISGSMEIRSADQQQAYTRLWLASYVASTVGLLLAQDLRLERASELSTQALLCYLGDLSILFTHPELAEVYLNQPSLFVRVNHQQQLLQTNAALIGRSLASHWELPAQVADGLRTSLVPMSTDPATLSALDLDVKHVTLCYTACRIGDLVSFHGVKDVADIDFKTSEGLEFFYLDEHLKAAGIDSIYKKLKEAALRRKLNQFIAHLST
ncbi:MAG: HDOD domain-containing protein [Halioglobus sp.]|nr:HDOD domain-containing protein [Halioglobus sp.]